LNISYSNLSKITIDILYSVKIELPNQLERYMFYSKILRFPIQLLNLFLQVCGSLGCMTICAIWFGLVYEKHVLACNTFRLKATQSIPIHDIQKSTYVDIQASFLRKM
jgi:hypothetical protein